MARNTKSLQKGKGMVWTRNTNRYFARDGARRFKRYSKRVLAYETCPSRLRPTWPNMVIVVFVVFIVDLYAFYGAHQFYKFVRIF